jgi:hypothetical protein
MLSINSIGKDNNNPSELFINFNKLLVIIQIIFIYVYIIIIQVCLMVIWITRYL